MTVQNFIKRFFYIFLVLFLLQIIFFILLQDLFKYTIFEQESFFFYFYSINYFIALFTVYLIIRYYKNENKFNLTFGGLNFDEISFKILGLVYLGILLSILSKSLLYFQPYFSGEITKYPNGYLTGSSSFDLSCTLTTIRSLWKVNTDLISNNQLQLFLYNVLSPLGTILLNLQAILFLIIYLLSNKINNKTYILIFFTLILNLLVYAVIVSSKNIIFNFFTLNLCFFIIALAVKKINLSKILTFIIFSFISFALVIFFLTQRSDCSISNQPNYNSEIEFENKYNVPENLGDDPEGKNELQEQNIQRSGRYFLIERESKVLNKFGLKQIENVTINYSLYYLLTGKINGEYIFENIKRPRIGNIILSKTLNIFSKDINKKIIDVQVYWPKAWGGISFLHLLWYDYYYFGIALFILFFIFLIIVIFKLKLNKTEFMEIINLLVIYLMAIFIYIFIQFFNWYSLETINSRFLFFNLLVFILYIYIKVKKNLNE